ncbi:MAG: N-acetyltransferase family protein [Actinomycetota bacterium]|nr:N-acetyltransferase family protein [Actinomycetota bacterium]
MGVHVRLATATDAPAIQAVYAPFVEATPISFEYEVPTADHIAARISATLPDFPWLVAEEAGRVVGYAYSHGFAPRAAYRWSVETSIYLDAVVHGRGLGRALYSRLLAVLSVQGYQEAFAGIALPNPASVALHEATGFVAVGRYARVGWKLGSWHDVGWWQRPLSPAVSPGPPQPAIPLDQLPRDALHQALGGHGA